MCLLPGERGVSYVFATWREGVCSMSATWGEGDVLCVCYLARFLKRNILGHNERLKFLLSQKAILTRSGQDNKTK